MVKRKPELMSLANTPQAMVVRPKWARDPNLFFVTAICPMTCNKCPSPPIAHAAGTPTNAVGAVGAAGAAAGAATRKAGAHHQGNPGWMAKIKDTAAALGGIVKEHQDVMIIACIAAVTLCVVGILIAILCANRCCRYCDRSKHARSSYDDDDDDEYGEYDDTLDR